MRPVTAKGQQARSLESATLPLGQAPAVLRAPRTTAAYLQAERLSLRIRCETLEDYQAVLRAVDLQSHVKHGSVSLVTSVCVFLYASQGLLCPADTRQSRKARSNFELNV